MYAPTFCIINKTKYLSAIVFLQALSPRRKPQFQETFQSWRFTQLFYLAERKTTIW